MSYCYSGTITMTSKGKNSRTQSLKVTPVYVEGNKYPYPLFIGAFKGNNTINGMRTIRYSLCTILPIGSQYDVKYNYYNIEVTSNEYTFGDTQTGDNKHPVNVNLATDMCSQALWTGARTLCIARFDDPSIGYSFDISSNIPIFDLDIQDCIEATRVLTAYAQNGDTSNALNGGLIYWDLYVTDYDPDNGTYPNYTLTSNNPDNVDKDYAKTCNVFWGDFNYGIAPVMEVDVDMPYRQTYSKYYLKSLTSINGCSVTISHGLLGSDDWQKYMISADLYKPLTSKDDVHITKAVSDNGKYVFNVHFNETPPSSDDEPDTGTETADGGGGKDIDDTDTDTDNSFDDYTRLTETHCISSENLEQLGTYFWTSGFLDILNRTVDNPVENIVSLKAIPFTNEGKQENLAIGNVDTKISALKAEGCRKYQSIVSFTVTNYYANFLDYEPYTAIDMYLPFVGIIPLTPSLITNKACKVNAIVDFVNGLISYQIFSGNTMIKNVEGVIGIDIPLTSTNKNELVSSFVSGIASSAVHLNALGTADTLINGAFAVTHSSQTSSPSSSIGCYMSNSIYLIITRPDSYNEGSTTIKAYNHTKGRPCNLRRKISQLKGFTKFSEIEIKDVPCTEKEIEEIKSILTNGFYA